MVIGTLIGMIAGYFGGRTDLIIMQVMDVLLAFPSLILGLIVVAMLGPSIANLVIAIALTAIPPFSRIARAPTIAVKNREFIEAGHALGYSHTRLMFRHILPNIAPEVLVMGSLWLATAHPLFDGRSESASDAPVFDGGWLGTSALAREPDRLHTCAR